MAAGALGALQTARHVDWVSKFCLKYVAWIDERRGDIYKQMSCPVHHVAGGNGASDIRIEPMGAGLPIGSLIRLYNRAYKGAGDYKRAGRIQECALKASKGFDAGMVWLAYEGGNAVGFVMARCLGGAGHVTGLAVLPSHRRRGIGTRLMQHAMSELAMRGAMDVELEVPKMDQGSRALYSKLGFT